MALVEKQKGDTLKGYSFGLQALVQVAITRSCLMRKSLLLVRPYIRRVCTCLSIGLLTVLTNCQRMLINRPLVSCYQEEVLERSYWRFEISRGQ